MPKVYLKFESAVIKELALTKDETTFGRKPTNDIVIDHPTVSGFHGKIKKQGAEWVVEDLNSTNGTFINGHRIKSGTLKDHDQIGIAKHILEFVLSDAAVAPPPPAPAPTAMPSPAKPSEPAKFDIPDNLKSAAQSILQGVEPAAASAKPPAPTVPPSVSTHDVPPVAASGDGKGRNGFGVVKVVSGAVDGFSEIHLKDLVTYIGTSDKAGIKIKGFLAPSLAAAISRRPEGYFLKAVKPGYPKVNGNPVQEQIFLENGALIEVGGTNMVFYHSDAKKNASENPS